LCLVGCDGKTENRAAQETIFCTSGMEMFVAPVWKVLLALHSFLGYENNILKIPVL
jgi:hypothetical protein